MKREIKLSFLVIVLFVVVFLARNLYNQIILHIRVML